jgi:MFS family permease
MLVGAYQGFAQYYRFAASEAASQTYRSKAISYVIAGGVFAAVAGPYLAVSTKELGSTPSYTGSFAVVTLLSVAAALVLVATRLPRVTSVLSSDRPSRTFRELARQPAFVAAIGGAALAYAVMGIPMTATPLSMVMHEHSVGSAAMVIQWHVLGMTAPSFFTGSLIKKFGVERVMLGGTAALGIHVAISSTGTEFLHYVSSLLVLGIGWNFLFVGATTLLTETHAEWEKAKVQGFNDLVVILVLTIGSFSAGPLHDLLGWRGLNLAMVPLIAVAALLIIRSMLSQTAPVSDIP